MKHMEFKLFVPPEYPNKEFDIQSFNNNIGRNFIYCSRGRHAIFHALKALEISGKVVLPCYACHTIRDSIISAGLEYIECDIDPDDMNISFESFEKLCAERNDIECVIVPSIYGNPADLPAFEKYCAEKKIRMIDDAAQSFGASIDNRYVCTFGDAGVIAFSPGKATPAPMGALLWCKNQLSWKRKKHSLIHKIIYKNYYINRAGAYIDYPSRYRQILAKISTLLERVFDIKNDDMDSVEKNVIGGVLDAALTGEFNFRKKYHDKFCERFGKSDLFYIVKNKRGVATYPKIVIVTKNEDIKKEMVLFLKEAKIAIYGGYPLTGTAETGDCASNCCKCIVELPIEKNDEKMAYLFDCIDNFLNINKLE